MYLGYPNRREFLYAQQGGVCYYCEKPKQLKKLTKEHLKKRADGGNSSKENVVLACAPCNNGRGNVSPEAWKIISKQILTLREQRKFNQRRPYRFLKDKLQSIGIKNPRFYHRLLAYNNKWWKPLANKYYKIRCEMLIRQAERS